MKVKELYDHITAHMTPEQALMKFLEGGLIQYNKLKFDSQEKAVHPLLIISMAAMDLGWQMAIRSDQDEVQGISVGTEDFMKDLFPIKSNNI